MLLPEICEKNTQATVERQAIHGYALFYRRQIDLTAYSGISANGLPYSRIGDGDVSLMVFPGLDLSSRPAEGLHLQGLAQAFKEFAHKHRVYVLGRPPGPDFSLPHDDSEEAWATDEGSAVDPTGAFAHVQTPEEYATELDRSYVDFVTSEGSGPVRILGIAYGGHTAATVAAALDNDTNGGTGRKLDKVALVSYAPRIAPEGEELLLRAAQRMKAGELRRFSHLMVRSMYPGLGGRLLFGPTAFLFPSLAGTPADPMTIAHLIRKQALEDGTELFSRLRCKTLFLAGGRDPYYPPEMLEEAVRLANTTGGEAVLRLFPNDGHGVFKSARREVHSVVSAFFAGEDVVSAGDADGTEAET